MNYSQILRHICAVFNRHSVEYMVIGGTSVALHGYYRQSVSSSGQPVDKPDLDFWFNPSYSNYYRLLAALQEIGRDVGEYVKDRSPDPKRAFFKFDHEDYTLELLPEIKAPLRFRDASSRKQTFDFQGVVIPFIGLDDLITDKLASGRAKDILDVEQLRKL